MIHIYSNLEISNNLSKNPTGLIKWIIDVLNEEKLDYRFYNEFEEINKLRNSKIIIYPSQLKSRLGKETKKSNKIISLGPDCNSLEIISLLKFRFSILQRFFKLKLFEKILINIFDKENISDKKTLIVVGEEDYKMLQKYNKNTFYLEHPYLSSIPNKFPIIPKSSKKLDLVIIGKLKGMPVGFYNITSTIENNILPILERNDILLYLFKTSGIRLTEKMISNKKVKIISKEYKLNKNFFQNKVVLNLTLCGAGTANRSLSALYDGAFLFSSKFGIRNINLELFGHQIGVSSNSPLDKKFYRKLENFITTRNNIDNRDLLSNINMNSKSKLLDIINQV